MEITICQAAEADCELISDLGRITVEEAHRDSCSAGDMSDYLARNYNYDAIRSELLDRRNIYHIIYADSQPAGFSKIVLNAAHPDIPEGSVTKLDRIYLLKEFYDMKLGLALLQFNIQFSKEHNQSGMWLFTWIGNTRAVSFYQKAGFTVIGTHDFQVSETHYNPNHHMLLGY